MLENGWSDESVILPVIYAYDLKFHSEDLKFLRDIVYHHHKEQSHKISPVVTGLGVAKGILGFQSLT
jgi:hypothetical protein